MEGSNKTKLKGPVVVPSSSKRKKCRADDNNKSELSDIDDGDHQQIVEGQCVICQKKICSETKTVPRRSVVSFLQDVPKAVVHPSFLASLNGVWPYLEVLRRKLDQPSREGDEEENDFDLSFVFEVNMYHSKLFSKVPAVCQLCADNVQAVGDLIKDLKSHLKKLRKIIVGSKSKLTIPDHDAAGAQVEGSLGNVDTTNTPCSSKSNKKGTSYGKEISESKTDVGIDDEQKPIQMKDSEEPQRPGINSELNDEELDIKVENMETEVDFADDLDYLSLNMDLDEEDADGNMSDAGDDKSWDGNDDEPDSDMDDISSAEHYSSESCEEENGATRKSKRVSKMDLKKSDSKITKATNKRKPSNIKNFQCDVSDCVKSFSTNRGLTRHQNRNHPEDYPANRTYPCTCGKIFLSRKGRLSHLRTSVKHRGEELFVGKKQTVCDMCGVAKTFEELEEHIRGHVGDYTVKCPNAPNCRYFFTNFLAISKHLERVKSCRKAIIGSGKGQSYFCETCDFKTDKVLMLRTHLKLNHERIPENRVLECPISGCSEMFSVRQSVHFHLKNNHNLREIATQKCVDCLQEIKIAEMEQHLKSKHHTTEVIKCSQCTFRFSSRQHLVTHLFVHRFDVDALVCDVCNDGIKFSRHGDLREHYHSIHQIGTKQCVCDECGKGFWNSNALNAHTKFHHTGEYKYKKKSFPCDLCYEPTDFSCEDGLICHKINVHGADPFRCKICDATFTAKAAFQRHEKDHAGIRRKEYKCTVKDCEKVFTCRKSLNQHNDVVHEGNKYDCELCGTTYLSASNLKKHHKRTHLKLQRFVCDVCGSDFSTNSVMMRHKLIHTGERPFVCTKCGQRFRQSEVLKRHMDAHEKKGEFFKPNGPMKQIRKRVGE